jgi:hypothetical protein
MIENLLDFQLAYSPRAFRVERATWTHVIFLNILRAINTVVSALAVELQLPTHTHTHNHTHAHNHNHTVNGSSQPSTQPKLGLALNPL